MPVKPATPKSRGQLKPRSRKAPTLVIISDDDYEAPEKPPKKVYVDLSEGELIKIPTRGGRKSKGPSPKRSAAKKAPKPAQKSKRGAAKKAVPKEPKKPKSSRAKKEPAGPPPSTSRWVDYKAQGLRVPWVRLAKAHGWDAAELRRQKNEARRARSEAKKPRVEYEGWQGYYEAGLRVPWKQLQKKHGWSDADVALFKRARANWKKRDAALPENEPEAPERKKK